MEAMAQDPDLLVELDAAVRVVNERHARVSRTFGNGAVLPGVLTVAEGELTPTLKVKRNVVSERFGRLISEDVRRTVERSATAGT